MVQAKAVQAAAKTKKKNLTRVKKEPDSSTAGEEVNELQRYLREPYKAAFKSLPPPLEAPPSTGSELVQASASAAEPLPIPRPSPVSVPEDSEEDEQEDARWTAFAQEYLETQQFFLEATERQIWIDGTQNVDLTSCQSAGWSGRQTCSRLRSLPWRVKCRTQG